MKRLPDGALRTAPQGLFEAASLWPDHIRYIEAGDEFTFSNLADRVARFAGFLREEGVEPGDHVAIFAPNSVDWLVAALGIQACGGAFVGIHAGSSADLASYIIDHSEARMLVACPTELDRTEEQRDQSIDPVASVGA